MFRFKYLVWEWSIYTYKRMLYVVADNLKPISAHHQGAHKYTRHSTAPHNTAAQHPDAMFPQEREQSHQTTEGDQAGIICGHAATA